MSPSAVQTLADALRRRILDGDLPAHARLVEQELTSTYDVARHTARAALRQLASEGLVVVEPNRGARVARMDGRQLRGLHELRTALECEAARLALERHDGTLPASVHAAVAGLARVCRGDAPPWSAVVDAHDAVHRALVEAARSPRITAAHRLLASEMRLFLVQLRPEWTLERMAGDHERLAADLEARGPEALRAHLAESTAALLAHEMDLPGMVAGAGAGGRQARTGRPENA
jgi:DNA-binding GntR family transcriptional regulator